MKSLPNSFLQFLKYHLANTKQPIILAVSGGSDSMALFHWVRLSGYNMIVAHVNYGLRGVDSDADATFVANICTSFNIPFYCKEARLISKNAESKQALARKIRYEFFDTLIETFSAFGVFTAHHADDDAETMLLQWGRGSDLKGIAGIPIKNGNIFRPLLGFSKEFLKNWLIQNGFEWRTDATNLLPIYRRNKIRLTVMPSLQSAIPGFPNPQTAMQLKSQLQLLQTLASEKLQYHTFSTPNGIHRLHLEPIENTPGFDSLLLIFLDNFGPLHPLKPALIFSKLPINERNGKELFLQNWRCWFENSYLFAVPEKLFGFNYELKLHLNQEITIQLPLGTLTLMYKPIKNFKHEASDKQGFVINADGQEAKLQIKPFENGQKLAVFTDGRQQLIADILTNNKCFKNIKRLTSTLIVNHKIAVLVGHKTDKGFWINNNSKYIIEGFWHPFFNK